MRILLVEDEPVISLNIQTMLVDLGHRPIAVSTVKDAHNTITLRQFDCALLDVNLPDGQSVAIGKILASIGVPFVFVTGALVESHPELPNTPLLMKPFGFEELARVVADMAKHVSKPAT